MKVFAQLHVIPSPQGWLREAVEPVFVERRRQQRRRVEDLCFCTSTPGDDRRLGPGRRLDDWRRASAE